MKRKIELMHYQFGITPGKMCRECLNLVSYRCRGTNYYKCAVYGETSSEASDWRLKYQACGMFNKEWTGSPIIKLLKHGSKEPEPELEGQLHFNSADGEE